VNCEQLQDLHTVPLSLAALRTQNLFVTVFEFDSSRNAEAIAGMGSLSLRQLKLRGKSMFDVRLSFGGIITGHLTGVLALNTTTCAEHCHDSSHKSITSATPAAAAATREK
jgi:hypothetical protein